MDSLYKIDSSIYEILENGFNKESVDDETGEILESKVLEQLDSLLMSRTDKLESIALYIKSLNAETLAIKSETEELTKRRKLKESKAERLKDYVRQSMLMYGDRVIETAKAVLKIGKSESLIIDNEDIVPSEYVTIAFEKKVDKLAIKRLIKDGQTIPGTHIELNNNLSIK